MPRLLSIIIKCVGDIIMVDNMITVKPPWNEGPSHADKDTCNVLSKTSLCYYSTLCSDIAQVPKNYSESMASYNTSRTTSSIYKFKDKTSEFIYIVPNVSHVRLLRFHCNSVRAWQLGSDSSVL